jgi:hypothetical protein
MLRIMVCEEQDKFNELYTLYNELDIVKTMKIGRLRWLGHLFRMQKLDPCRKLTLLKPEDTWLVCAG